MFSIDEIMKITAGRLTSGEKRGKVRGVCINSKLVRKGDLFLAIRGQRLDGHRFIREAIRRGAAAVMVSRPVARSLSRGQKKPAAVIRVDDTIRALGKLARAHRDRFSIPVIAVTGSAGKTTTKEMISTVLSSRWRVLCNSGTENNHIGVPMTLFRLRPSHQVAVLELGTNRFGDIPWLTYVSSPTIAVFTNIGAAHLERLGSIQGVYREKSALVKDMPVPGVVIFNRDDRFLKKLPGIRRRHRCIAYGTARGADYRAGDIHANGRHSLSFKVNDEYSIVLNTPVHSYVYNALAAISCGQFFHISYQEIESRLRRLHYLRGRQSVLKIGGISLIDDTYNANVVSFRSALSTLSSLQTKGRKILVGADMLELGADAAELHRSIGRGAAKAGLDLVLTFGPLAKNIARVVREERPETQTLHCASLAQLHKRLTGYCRAGDAILVKGSRSMHMERTVEFLKKQLAKKNHRR